MKSLCAVAAAFLMALAVLLAVCWNRTTGWTRGGYIHVVGPVAIRFDYPAFRSSAKYRSRNDEFYFRVYVLESLEED